MQRPNSMSSTRTMPPSPIESIIAASAGSVPVVAVGRSTSELAFAMAPSRYLTSMSLIMSWWTSPQYSMQRTRYLPASVKVWRTWFTYPGMAWVWNNMVSSESYTPKPWFTSLLVTLKTMGRPTGTSDGTISQLHWLPVAVTVTASSAAPTSYGQGRSVATATTMPTTTSPQNSP